MLLEVNDIHDRTWKVGELAQDTGLTVRTLHHYDRIGLLSPSRRSPAGHRLYAGADIVRLQQIMSLKYLGFSLDEIGALIDNPDFNPIEVITLQLDQSSLAHVCGEYRTGAALRY